MTSICSPRLKTLWRGGAANDAAYRRLQPAEPLGEVVFNATLDTATLSTDKGDPIPDPGLYVWSHDSLLVVARTSTVIPGVGTIARLGTIIPTFEGRNVDPDSGANNNDCGQVVFGARLIENDEHGEQRGVLLVATPK